MAEPKDIYARNLPHWQPESYDRVIRNADDLRRILAYVPSKPTSAGLVEAAGEWPFCFLAEKARHGLG